MFAVRRSFVPSFLRSFVCVCLCALLAFLPLDNGKTFGKWTCWSVRYEAVGDEKLKKAMEFYVLAGRYNHAIRLAIANEFDIDITQLAMQCPDPPVVKVAARYFEQRGDFDKAISLYRQVCVRFFVLVLVCVFVCLCARACARVCTAVAVAHASLLCILAR